MPAHEWTGVDAGIFHEFHGDWIYISGLHRTGCVGMALPDMPLFLEPETYVNVPLETAYLAAFAAVPRYWRDVLGSRTTR
jgi:hypothetical protein